MEIKNWKLKFRNEQPIDATAPCSLFSVLLENKKIKDPFLADNEAEVKELANEDCIFSADFCIDEAVLNAEHVILRFNGLDTVCSVFLNGKLLDKTDNMHITYDFDVHTLLKNGENHIDLYFHSPIKEMQRRNSQHEVWTQGDILPGAATLRKALYMSGWDWGPTLPDMGIFRKVELLYWNGVQLNNLMVRQEHLENKVLLHLNTEYTGTKEEFSKAKLSAELLFEDNVVAVSELDQDGNCLLTVNNPQLWWPNGYGNQPLYKLTVTMKQPCSDTQAIEKSIGLRTLTVSQQPDEWGKEFCFCVNGIKIFAMGANYIPQDNLICRVTPEKIEHLLSDCVKANFNCLRVWGGGYYPDDYFYDCCDRMGLVVWQDFMFACVNVYLSESFTKSIIAEFTNNLRRIRHHASLGLLCGNNEMESAVISWGIGNSELVRMDYLQLYEHILPDLCDKLAPDIFYWPSSPSSGGGFDNPESNDVGDRHYWQVWHGNKPFEEYRNNYFRFCSEFGFEAFPNIKTIREFAEKKDENPFSYIMECHQKCKSGNTKILTYLAANYLYPSDFETLVYTSQLLQADAIRYAVEHFRRFRGRCMGATYWQLNDCWPVVSWSSVDYFGRWKALHYVAKRFFAPVLISAHETGYDVVFNISNETREKFVGQVEYEICESDFSVVFSDSVAAEVMPLSSCDVVKLNCTDYLKGHERTRYLCWRLLDSDKNVISSSSMIFVKPKHFCFKKPNISIAAEPCDGGTRLIVSSDCYAKGVEVDFCNTDAVLSDNYFDIISERPVELTVETDVTSQKLLSQINVRSVWDIGNSDYGI